ncbi:spore germination protein [Bacillus pseudomycoides]|uniref:Spore germination protein n=1 Tax=Bacillus pseudomycoides TaxID=64104 RepID=A0A2B5HDY3_9BACI|nr:spore germination protein [Bacillus pseudomycoides]PED05858.1 spore germination protein [Bacillus pseudomycoides]PEK26071.1 spore germination protein [Bacillus pseudomycoides]PEM65425.1 spore germination protein [Bacillus pseudomycoides]PEO21439.1 spore germination protein [Bacillus pseudomycoides]PEP66841.1 spore germination protein [Bacillus pseudomycoides]
MAKFLKRLKYRGNPKSFSIQDNTHFRKENIEDSLLDADLSKNIADIQNIFRQAPDLVIRRFQMTADGLEAALVYLSGLTDKQLIQHHVLNPLMNSAFDTNTELPITLGQIKIINTCSQIENAIFGGDSVLLIHGRTTAHQLDTKGWPQRNIEDAHNEIALKGAHQGFTETGSQNIAMIRRYIPHRELMVKEIIIGIRSKTRISILYLKDVASEDVLKELETRIQDITVDAVESTGELIEFIEDNPYSPFPQFMLTERPDMAVSHILQGRFVVVVDHSPSVLIAPTNFISFFQGIDDYGTRWLVASSIRILRFIAFMIALFLPASYVAFISFNFEVIPVELFLSIAESRTRVPFSPVMEALLMEMTLEMMREGALRLPTPIGQTVGIVGGIIIGQAAVQAGIVSNIMIIVVAVTAIASFIIPNYDMGAAVRLLRFPMMLSAALFGIVGLVIGWMTLIAHLISLESLGTPYGTPLAPFRFADMKDTFVRFPLWAMRSRPKGTGATQSIRQGKNHNKR